MRVAHLFLRNPALISHSDKFVQSLFVLEVNKRQETIHTKLGLGEVALRPH